MKAIKDNIEKKLVIKKSKFIGFVIEINSKEEAEKYISEYHEKYKDATHVCYAYIVNNHEKMCDDGEPSGTAGMPMLNLLKTKDLNNVLGIVVRYFGGIKLGANGLVHAYVDSLNNVLVNNIVDVYPGYNIVFSFDYSLVKDIDYIIRDEIINKKLFNENIVYDIDCNEDTYLKLKSKNINVINIKNKLIKK